MPEAGGVTDDVGRVERAVDGDDAVGDDALDAGAHELDVVLAQAREPRAVVLQHALGGRRVVGDHLGLELRVAAELGEHQRGEQLARRAVRRADRETAVVVVGVDA